MKKAKTKNDIRTEVRQKRAGVRKDADAKRRAVRAKVRQAVACLLAVLTLGIAATLGITVGALAGYFGGWVDAVVSRATEVVMCVPSLVLILALLAIVEKPTIWKMMAVLGLTG